MILSSRDPTARDRCDHKCFVYDGTQATYNTPLFERLVSSCSRISATRFWLSKVEPKTSSRVITVALTSEEEDPRVSVIGEARSPLDGEKLRFCNFKGHRMVVCATDGAIWPECLLVATVACGTHHPIFRSDLGKIWPNIFC